MKLEPDQYKRSSMSGRTLPDSLVFISLFAIIAGFALSVAEKRGWGFFGGLVLTCGIFLAVCLLLFLGSKFGDFAYWWRYKTGGRESEEDIRKPPQKPSA